VQRGRQRCPTEEEKIGTRNTQGCARSRYHRGGVKGSGEVHRGGRGAFQETGREDRDHGDSRCRGHVFGPSLRCPRSDNDTGPPRDPCGIRPLSQFLGLSPVEKGPGQDLLDGLDLFPSRCGNHSLHAGGLRRVHLQIGRPDQLGSVFRGSAHPPHIGGEPQNSWMDNTRCDPGFHSVCLRWPLSSRALDSQRLRPLPPHRPHVHDPRRDLRRPHRCLLHVHNPFHNLRGLPGSLWSGKVLHRLFLCGHGRKAHWSWKDGHPCIFPSGWAIGKWSGHDRDPWLSGLPHVGKGGL
jgi:hypothetical protein